MLSKAEKAQIKALLQSPQWGSLDHLVKDVLESVKENSLVKETEWETLKATLIQEGQVQGITRLVQEIWKATDIDA